ncbi:hypothetical protein EJ07DRAFT_185716 [Lizonia empirigonia]|nr:hypothetical protein EJ07DRAFT_185716 [Lizonia empirigonia]
MEPADIIASVNRENAELQAKAFEIYKATESINGLHQHIHFLQSYIAHIENQSKQGMLACQQTAKFFERENAAELWSNHQWSQEAANLSTATTDLQKAVLTKIEKSQPSDKQTQQLMDKITDIESNILFKEIQNNDLKHTLREKKDRPKEVQIATTAMIAARDDLNRKLNAANKTLQSKVGSKARTLNRVKNEKDHLEKELANAEAVLAGQEETKVQLQEVIRREERLQIKYQAALAEAENLRLSTDFYRREDSNQVKVITSLQREVAALQNAERQSGYTKIMNEQKAEIAQLVSNQARLEGELRRNKHIVDQSLTKMVEQVCLTNEAKKEAARNRGHALGIAHSLLDSLAQTKMDFAKNVVDTVYAMLKSLDSEQKAKEAIAQIEGYLVRQDSVICSFAANVASNGGEVQNLITDLLKKTPKQPMPKEIKEFISYVRGLQVTLERGLTHPPV